MQTKGGDGLPGLDRLRQLEYQRKFPFFNLVVPFAVQDLVAGRLGRHTQAREELDWALPAIRLAQIRC